MTESDLLVVRLAAPRDVPWSAARHRRWLRHGLFPRLGDRFLRRWHLDHIRSPHAVMLVAETSGGRAGFLVGSTDSARHVAWVLRRDRWALVALGAAGLAVRPHELVRFARTRAPRYARRLLGIGAPVPGRTPADPASGTSGATSAPPTGDGADGADGADKVAVLQAIAVDPAARGTGAGKALVDAFVRTAAASGAACAELVTKSGSDGASGFYEMLGWTFVDEHRDRDGDLTRRYRLELDGDEPGGPAVPNVRLLRRRGRGGAAAAPAAPGTAIAVSGSGAGPAAGGPGRAACP